MTEKFILLTVLTTASTFLWRGSNYNFYVSRRFNYFFSGGGWVLKRRETEADLFQDQHHYSPLIITNGSLFTLSHMVLPFTYFMKTGYKTVINNILLAQSFFYILINHLLIVPTIIAHNQKLLLASFFSFVILLGNYVSFNNSPFHIMYSVITNLDS